MAADQPDTPGVAVTTTAPDPLPAAAWTPPEGHIVGAVRGGYFVYVGSQRYEHVSEAPDGRWVYKPS